MSKLIITAVLFFLVQSLAAQKGIDGLINAERKFAAYSVANGTKDAFLKFADSSGIVFDNGKPVNAIETWSKREKRLGKLNWFPEVASIASSQDFGYTTGPWNFSTNDTVRIWGYYITVWHLNSKREWKFLVDLGVSDINCDFISLRNITLKAYYPNKEAKASLRKAEEDLISGYSLNGKSAYANVITSTSRLYRNKMCAAENDVQRQFVLDSTPLRISYTISGEGMSSSNDLGYVYGSTFINGKTENYLRIWRREKDGWKIAVEVLRY